MTTAPGPASTPILTDATTPSITTKPATIPSGEMANISKVLII